MNRWGDTLIFIGGIIAAVLMTYFWVITLYATIGGY